jgi:hypothetical protein
LRTDNPQGGCHGVLLLWELAEFDLSFGCRQSDGRCNLQVVVVIFAGASVEE